MRTLSVEQKAKADERKAQFRALVKQIGAMNDVERVQLASKMGALVTPEQHALSLHNTLLVCLQKPDATIVGGFKQWLKHGRAVRKGEHGLMIWFPRCKKAQTPAVTETAPVGDDVAKLEVRFLMGTVFDISQTMEIETAQAEAA